MNNVECCEVTFCFTKWTYILFGRKMCSAHYTAAHLSANPVIRGTDI